MVPGLESECAAGRDSLYHDPLTATSISGPFGTPPVVYLHKRRSGDLPCPGDKRWVATAWREEPDPAARKGTDHGVCAEARRWKDLLVDRTCRAGLRFACLNQSVSDRCGMGRLSHIEPCIAAISTLGCRAQHLSSASRPCSVLKGVSHSLRVFNCRAATRRTDRYMAPWLGSNPG